MGQKVGCNVQKSTTRLRRETSDIIIILSPAPEESRNPQNRRLTIAHMLPTLDFHPLSETNLQPNQGTPYARSPSPQRRANRPRSQTSQEQARSRGDHGRSPAPAGL